MFYAFNGKLSFQQFDKQGRNTRSGGMTGVQNAGWLQLLAVMDKLKHIVSQQVVFISVTGR
jgi:hypothetical protein